jgi:hypothetical protein
LRYNGTSYGNIGQGNAVVTGGAATDFGLNATTNMLFATGGITERMRLDSSGDLLVGTTSNPDTARLHVSKASGEVARFSSPNGTSSYITLGRSDATGEGMTLGYNSSTGDCTISTITTHPLIFRTNNTERARIDSSGNLLVGTTSAFDASYRGIQVTNSSGSDCAIFKTTGVNGSLVRWNSATSGDNVFINFYTETSITARGSITYNRAGGLTAYNTTSDYRAKDISGPVTGSGALIDSTPVYMGKMKDATQERPMFIAHEVPAYAHTGEKDAVDADGKPVYQQMDASALIPVMWAEIQSLRKRLADAGIA